MAVRSAWVRRRAPPFSFLVDLVQAVKEDNGLAFGQQMLDEDLGVRELTDIELLHDERDQRIFAPH